MTSAVAQRKRRTTRRRQRGWKLTRRGRLAVGVLITALLTLLLVPGLLGDASAAGPSTASESVLVVVGVGDTVWDLALGHIPPGEDPTSFVARVVAENGVDAGALRPGSVLRLPQG